MAFVKKDDTKLTAEGDIRKFRILLSSRDAKPLEKVCGELLTRAKERKHRTAGPVRLPTRNLKLTVRKSPCGNGSASWDQYEMNIFKRLIDVYSTSEQLTQVTAISIEPGVDIEIKVAAA